MVKVNGKGFPVHNTEANRGKAPVILTLGAGCDWSTSPPCLFNPKNGRVSV